MDKNRIIALTDGIVAIAATIMVLELQVPERLSTAMLLAQWPVLLAYIVSFSQIYLAWRSHHNAFQKADVISTRTFLINGIWLFFQTLVPFGTGLIGRFSQSSLAAVIYVMMVFLWTLTFQFLDWSIVKDNPAAEKDEVMYPVARLILFGGYDVAFAVAFVQANLVLPIMLLFTILMGLQAIHHQKAI